MKKISLNADGIKELFNYATMCLLHECTNDGTSFANLLMFHIKAVHHKLQVKQLDVVYKGRKSVVMPLNYAEQITLSYMFNRVETTPFLKQIEFDIIGGI